MGRFDRQIKTADRLVKKNGLIVRLRRYETAALPDATRPWDKGATTVIDPDLNVWALRSVVSLRKVDGQEVLATDWIYTVAASQFVLPDGSIIVPDKTMQFIVTDEIVTDQVWDIKEVEPLNPNEQVILYHIRVRAWQTTTAL